MPPDRRTGISRLQCLVSSRVLFLATITIVWLLLAMSVGAATAPAPTFTLMPDRGPCGVPIVGHGQYYPPGASVGLDGPYGLSGRSLEYRGGPRTVVADDGAFSLVFQPC